MGQETVTMGPASTFVTGGTSAVDPPLGALPPASLAPGFRFHPTDEELVTYYLRRKVSGKPLNFQAMSEVNVYKFQPWELSSYSPLKTRDLEWYFFSPVDRKYGNNSSRLNRSTGNGCWNATGKDRCVSHNSRTIGMKKTLIFHDGKRNESRRTNWVMHEYRLVDEELEKVGAGQDAFVLCKIFQKSGLGRSRIGDRYAPYLDEEWNDEMPKSQEQYPSEPEGISSFFCKRDKPEDPLALSLGQSKRPKLKQDDPNSSHAIGTEDSTTKFSFSPLEFPLPESVGPKESLAAAEMATVVSSNLEKSVTPGYFKIIGHLEKEIANVYMERDALKMELIQAQATINILQSRKDLLNNEIQVLRTLVRGG